ncbi:protein translocase subunit SecF [Acetonema longum]|uniref:Protein-export membrane protein SecF n=1 Tax=Acetonema longum DSM 6540 TaxID=1009370 RepID=F7NND7_9FIRM|nr:protein translocase subunit SecF [Acetonema longum]EGO62449.1 preprotein translocase subunit SecF [Acetonema longum DSM 6540]
MIKFKIVSRRKWWFSLSAIVLLAGLISIAVQGFNFGIDFTGGTLLDLKFARPVTVSEVREALKESNLENSVIQLASGSAVQAEAAVNVIIRTPVLSEDEQRAALAGLGAKLGAFEPLRIEKVGATIGEELTRQSIWALLAAMAMIVAYVTYRFEFWFAISGIAALFHDILFILGIFSILQLEVDATFVAALLTIIGYSVNDTIVIFDRIRENLKTHRKTESLDDMVDRSIWQTMTRSIYTVVTLLVTVVALFVFGGETTKLFSFALLMGLLSGSYSTIFVASPLWITFKGYSDKRRLEARMKGSK